MTVVIVLPWSILPLSRAPDTWHALQIDFMAGWCGKCRMIVPAVEELQKEYPGVEFYKFDTSDSALEGLSADLGVSALPAFKFYKGGQEVRKEVVGYKKKLLQDAVREVAKGQ
jgi:thioredoxin 1